LLEEAVVEQRVGVLGVSLVGEFGGGGGVGDGVLGNGGSGDEFGHFGLEGWFVGVILCYLVTRFTGVVSYSPGPGGSLFVFYGEGG
jgi:hypothetical protein